MIKENKLFIVYDDREFTNNENKPFVGDRHYSEIIYRRRKLVDYFQLSLSGISPDRFFHLRKRADVDKLRRRIEEEDGQTSIFIVASRAGITANEQFKQLLARLPYAECSFSDRVFKPLLMFLKNSHELIANWEHFSAHPAHTWEQPQKEMERLASVKVLDLGQSRDFLTFMGGSTEARHFNEMEIDAYFYTKKSTDKKKIEAEYRFYNLVPEAMRPWLIQPFDFRLESDNASYKMMRYNLADAALQWVHGAFDNNSFRDFIDRMLFFISERPRKPAPKKEVHQHAENLYLNKVESRVQQLLEMPDGQKINAMVQVADPDLEILTQVKRYKTLYKKYYKEFSLDYLVAGHGDPCFSNILYDQQRYILKAIDPKGALAEDEVWTHPYYDLCKISHSVMGNYDFINNGLYEVSLTHENNICLKIHSHDCSSLQGIFMQRLQVLGYNWRVIRLAEASLFLSMLPLHVDHPNKVMAFVLTARKILDEVQHGR